jgi:DNA-directed RNA polymerase sigma subunit (sigma70/sigma32)
MSEIQQMIDQVRGVGKTFRAVVALCDMIEKIGSIERAMKDAVASKEAAYRDCEEAEGKLKAKLGEVADMEKVVKNMKTLSVNIEAEAQRRKSAIISEAEAKAKEICAGAVSLREALETKIREHESSKSGLVSQISDRRVELTALDQKLSELRKKAEALFR